MPTTEEFAELFANIDYMQADGETVIDASQADYPDQIRSDGYVWTYDPDDASAGEDGYKRTDYKVDASIDFDALTPEQYQSLIDNIKADLVFATEETCAAAAAEIAFVPTV